jgi:PilZ domain
MSKDDTATRTATGQRQSLRIRYAYRIRLTGKDSAGEGFNEDARTEIVTRDGGLIVTRQSLATSGHLQMSRGNNSAEVRIVGQVGLRNEEYLYGVQFTDPKVTEFWGVSFPPSSSDPGVGRAVLQCSRCGGQQATHLGEIEMMVFQTTNVIPRDCPRCHDETLWVEPDVLGEADVVIGSASFELQGAPRPRVRTGNDRRYNRISLKNMMACLQRQGCADDVVAVIDMSRSGIRFVSNVDYRVGMRVEVAVPYTRGGANLFAPAKIARVQSRPTASLPGEYGLQYVK